MEGIEFQMTYNNITEGENSTEQLYLTARIPDNTFFGVGFGNNDVIMFRALSSINTYEVRDMNHQRGKSVVVDEIENLLSNNYTINEEDNSVTF